MRGSGTFSPSLTPPISSLLFLFRLFICFYVSYHTHCMDWTSGRCTTTTPSRTTTSSRPSIAAVVRNLPSSVSSRYSPLPSPFSTLPLPSPLSLSLSYLSLPLSCSLFNFPYPERREGVLGLSGEHDPGILHPPRTANHKIYLVIQGN